MMAVDREYIMVIGGSDRRSVNGDVYRYDTGTDPVSFSFMNAYPYEQ